LRLSRWVGLVHRKGPEDLPSNPATSPTTHHPDCPAPAQAAGSPLIYGRSSPLPYSVKSTTKPENPEGPPLLLPPPLRPLPLLLLLTRSTTSTTWMAGTGSEWGSAGKMCVEGLFCYALGTLFARLFTSHKSKGGSSRGYSCAWHLGKAPPFLWA
jgi:hypothetical protein